MTAGRPKLNVTPTMREQVASLAGCGMSHIDIARVLGCTKPTLAKHFKEELRDGAAKTRAAILSILFDLAKAGNVSAARRLEELSRPVAPPDTNAGVRGPEGKKAAAARAAETAGAGTDWGDDLEPHIHRDFLN